MAARIKKQSLKRQTRDREATKAALIDAGERLFAEHGFRGTTLDMLAEASGANKAMASYYFGSKEGLYDAVIEALVTEVVAAVSDAVEDNGDAVSNFRLYIRGLARALAQRPTFGAILLREYMSGSMQEREKPFREVFKFYQMTEKLYREGRRQKVFRKLDPHQLHLSIIGPLIHFVLTMEFRKRTFARLAGGVEDPSTDDFARHLERLLLDGARTGAPAKRSSKRDQTSRGGGYSN